MQSSTFDFVDMVKNFLTLPFCWSVQISILISIIQRVSHTCNIRPVLRTCILYNSMYVCMCVYCVCVCAHVDVYAQIWHFLTQSSLIPWNFLSDRNMFYSNGMALGKPLDCFRMGTNLHKDPTWIRSLELSAPFSQLLGREEGWRLS